MNKDKIRLTESQLHRVIKESVNKILNELSYPTMQSAYQKAMQMYQRTGDERYNQQADRIEQSFQSMCSDGEQGNRHVPNYGNDGMNQGMSLQRKGASMIGNDNSQTSAYEDYTNGNGYVCDYGQGTDGRDRSTPYRQPPYGSDSFNKGTMGRQVSQRARNAYAWQNGNGNSSDFRRDVNYRR
jgi:hypothetical protein